MKKGMDLSRAYYLAFGKTMVKERFPRYAGRIACGFAGEGSDAFGFDDAFSKDHDWGAGFCLWLTDEDMETIGKEVQEAYDGLPQTFGSAPKKVDGKMATGRTGAISISQFYTRYTGFPQGPVELDQWIRVPEHFLATATNGQVFDDPYGQFSQIRERLLKFYPEDVRIKKLSANCHKMGQAGQYNYPRLLKRNDPVAAMLALCQFAEGAMKAVYLLNKRYAPYYKWTFKGLSQLTKLADIGPLLVELCQTPCRQENAQIIESICVAIRKELMAQGLTKRNSDFLCDQSFSLIEEIQEASIAGLPLTMG